MINSVNVENRPSLRPIHLKILRHLAHANILCSAFLRLDFCDKDGTPKDTGIHVGFTANEISEEIGESLRSTRKACNELAEMNYIIASTADSPEEGRGRKPIYYIFKGDFHSAFALDERDDRDYLDARVFVDERITMLVNYINSLPTKGGKIEKAEEERAKKIEELKKGRRGGWPSRKTGKVE